MSSGSMSNFYVGVSGLQVSQNALNTTSHNLVNVDTKGYVRQQVLIADSKYYTIGQSATSLSQVGSGAQILTLRQIRDRFLDEGYRIEIGRQGFYESQAEAVDEVENLFGELEGTTFKQSMNDFWQSIQELSKEPDSIVSRTAIIESAVSFIERADNISKQLRSYQVSINTEIQTKVDKINNLGEQIKDLNDKIVKAESNGLEKANDLRDKRNNCLDELGQLIKITYSENLSGVVSVSAENTQFITEDSMNYLETKIIGEGSDLLHVVWAKTNSVPVFKFDKTPSAQLDTDIGSLKGLLLARGTEIGKYTDIPICPVKSSYGSDADYEAAMATYTEASKEYNSKIQPSVIMTAQAQFDQLIHGIVTSINDILCPNVNIKLQDGTTITVYDEENAPIGMNNDKSGPQEALFVRKSMDRYSELTTVTLEDGTTKDVYIYNKEDEKNNYSLYTIGEIAVNRELLLDESKLPLSSNTGSNEYDIKSVEKLTSLWQQSFAALDPNSQTKNNFNEYYTAFVGEIANRGYIYKAISESQKDTVSSIDTQRQQVTGVSSDEELTNLIRFQQAFNAASRYINVVSEMLEHIVTRL